MNLLSKDQLPENFAYPSEFIKIVDQKLIDLEPWVIMDGEYLKDRLEGVKERYPTKTLVPFARRLDSDDIACWDASVPNKVFIIHDFAAQGWEARASFDNFWAWFKKAIDDMIEHDL